MRSARIVLGAGLCGALALAVASPTDGEAQDRFSEAALRERFPDPDRGAAEEDYTGSADCRECHRDRFDSLSKSFHAELRRDVPGRRGCETCHGPGFEHFADGGEAPIRHPEEAPAAESVAVCLKCHLAVLTEPVSGHRRFLEPEGPDGEPRRCVHCHAVHVDRDSPAHSDAVGPFPTVAALDAAAEPVPPGRCISCHPGFHPEMRRSGHRALLAQMPGCGACHGEGSLHADSGGDRRKIVDPRDQRAPDADATCLTCHGRDAAVARWTCAEHSKEGVACIVCHDANAPAGRTLRAGEFELCGGCHLDVQAKLRLPNRHRVAEGRVLCSDCHDPHGNTGRVRDRDVRLRACAACHPEKAGPFLFDHGIKRSEGCVACHDPHGSANRRMLTYARMRPMCLQCHPETPHPLNDRKYENCIACHVEIHGSDLDRIFRR